MPVLLCSLGTSWAVVPEAFHLLPPGPAGFHAVHVLTSASRQIDSGIGELLRYFGRFPGVDISVTRVDGFTELRSEEDHFAFEEVLYRWMLECRQQAGVDRGQNEAGGMPGSTCTALPHVCLAGGFKTMSAAMQKAAAVLGAVEVFHVLADPIFDDEREPGRKLEARTGEEVDHALGASAVRFVRLGPESGWPQFRGDTASEYPLQIVRTEGQTRWVRAADTRFRTRLREIVERSHRIAENWSSLGDLPFAELATWPAADLAWLREPLAPSSPSDRVWLEELPKIELHCHLGGFATHGEELAAVRAAAESPATLPPLRPCNSPSDWPLPAVAIGLEAYRKLGDNNGSTLLRDAGCLRAQCEQLYAHFLAQRVVYAEVRCSPANYADPTRGRSPLTVLSEIRETFQRCMGCSRPTPDAPPACHVNLLVIATRQDRGDFRSAISRHLTLAVTAAEHWTDDSVCRVVGVDLAGYEDVSTRAHIFRDDFKAVHRCNLALTAHAGENDDAEGIWSAVLELNVRRLGHALSLRESQDLLRTVADRGIAVEMCPYANLQIKGFPIDDAVAVAHEASRYPLLDYLRAGVRVTVNTDNIGISAASLADNLLLAARLCPGVTRLDALGLQRHALDAAFIPTAVRSRLVALASRGIPKP